MNKLIAFLVLLALVISVPSTEAALNVAILSHQGYVGSTGSYYIVGEVQNVGNQAYKYVEVIATFYNTNGSVVGTEFTYIELYVLHPSAKSPFKILFLEKNVVPLIDHYSLSVSYDPATARPGNLKILSNTSYVGQTGNLHVVGEIQNNGNNTANYVEVFATFYDTAGNVVAEESTFSNPSTLSAGQKAPFDILFVEKARVPLIDHYVLTAESNEYSLEGTIMPSASPIPTTTPSPSPLQPSTTPTRTVTETPTPIKTINPTSTPNTTETSVPTQITSQSPTSTTTIPLQPTSPVYSTETPMPSATIAPSPSIPEFPKSIIIALIAALLVATTLLVVLRRHRHFQE
ncbi:MAG: FxLYD domain-containing protein [Candidatus Bathyarchaeia archaeon]